ncbi:MAG: serine hydrolase [Muribaculaceae bacterium]|nr:serine hydrolase [Alistipes senegalensis]MCM1473365.1 serine hydrolase [Muribaculaceae bacterium]
MKNKSKKKKQARNLLTALVFLLIIVCICGTTTYFYIKGNSGEKIINEPPSRTGITIPAKTEKNIESVQPETESSVEEIIDVYPEWTENSKKIDNENDYDLGYAILMNADTNEIVAGYNESSPMFPASLTKIMTLIVAVENIENMSDKVTITEDMVYPMAELDAVLAGFQPGETPTVEDVLYGMVLSSGADAALAIAEYVSGSEEDFVKLMNDKVTEIGLKRTHFTNVVGLHSKEHYSTAEDMALILDYAIQNETCRRIISTYEYIIAPTEQNPEGMTFTSNFFSRMYGDEISGVSIKGGKTGFTDEAGNCVESFAEINGQTYILVLCKCRDKWTAIYDTLNIYSVYGAGGEKYYTYEKEEETTETEEETFPV